MSTSKKAEGNQTLEYYENLNAMILDIDLANDAIKCISKILVATQYLDVLDALPDELGFVRDDFSQAALHRVIVQISEGIDKKIAALENHKSHKIMTCEGNA